MSTLQELQDWLAKEPNATEVIIIRRKNNDYAVKIEYGNRTMVPRVNTDLETALSDAIRKADAMPSSARHYAEKKSKPVTMTMPGSTAPAMPG